MIDGRINGSRLLYEVLDEKITQTTEQALDRCKGVAGVLLGLAEDVYTFPRFINNDSEVVFEYWTPVDDIFTANLWRLPLTADRLNTFVDQRHLVAKNVCCCSSGRPLSPEGERSAGGQTRRGRTFPSQLHIARQTRDRPIRPR